MSSQRKELRTLADLAINGALPAFEQSLHVGRPNIGSRENFNKYIDDIFGSLWLTNNGPLVQDLEQRVAEYHHVKHCVAMCNGTVALEIAIRALGLSGEVIVPSYTFVATAHALHWQGITPVFVDINPETHNIDPSVVHRMITPRTTGIIGVHLWGRAAPVEALQEIANQYRLKLMFDAAHAFACSHQGKMIGSFGNCEVFSFHATKFFNTFEGGAVVTNDDALAEKLRLMRNFGFAGFDKVIYPGINGKMIEVAAAMGLVNFESIENVIEKNRSNYLAYCHELSGISGINIVKFQKRELNNYQYVVIEVGEDCAVTRDRIVETLHAENILARKYFWPGCHNMQPYKELFPHAGLLLPNTQLVAERVVVLPTGTMVDEATIKIIAAVIRILVESERCA